MRRITLLCFSIVLALPACGGLFDPAAAVVDGTKITTGEVEAGVDTFAETAEFERLTAQGDPDAIKRQFEQAYLSRLIRRMVFQPLAEDFGVEVTEDEVQERLDEIKADFPDEEAFQQTLQEQGLTLPQLEDLVRDNELEAKIRAEVTADAGPTDDELQSFYEENEADFQQTEAQHILVEEKALAEEIAGQLQAAKENQVDDLFARLARRYSTDPSNKDNGGELQPFRAGETVEEFETAAAELEIGEISEPVRTEFGYHVIRVTGRELLPFEEVSDQIAEQIGVEAQDEAWVEYVEKAYRDADIKLNPRYGELDIETQQVIDATAEDIPGAEEPAVDPTPIPEQTAGGE